MEFVFNDGGRLDTGYKGKTRDCVCRAIAIATNGDYQEIYKELNLFANIERPRNGKSRSSSRTGIKKTTIRKYMKSIGWNWTPTMQIGAGCKVHLKADELPAGKLIVSVSKHLTAVIDGTIHDTHNPSRAGTRCVYGYFSKSNIETK